MYVVYKILVNVIIIHFIAWLYIQIRIMYVTTIEVSSKIQRVMFTTGVNVCTYIIYKFRLHVTASIYHIYTYACVYISYMRSHVYYVLTFNTFDSMK